MKKIFTLLFFAGLVSSAAFAQNKGSRQGQHNYPSGDNRNRPSTYSQVNNRGNSNAYGDNSGHSQSYQDHNRNNEQRHGYGQERNQGARNNRVEFRNDYPEYNYERRMRNGRYSRDHRWFNVRFEKHGRW